MKQSLNIATLWRQTFPGFVDSDGCPHPYVWRVADETSWKDKTLHGVIYLTTSNPRVDFSAELDGACIIGLLRAGYALDSPEGGVWVLGKRSPG